MYKSEVISYFGSVAKVARALNIRRASVYDWPEDKPIPELRARQLAERCSGLRFDPTLYAPPKRTYDKPHSEASA